MRQPRALARGSVLVIALLVLLALPMQWAPAEAGQYGESTRSINRVAEVGRTPGNAGVNPAEAQPAPRRAVLPGDVVISEVRFIGSNGEPDEFIELYNRNCSEAIPLNGWKLKISDSGGVTNDTFFSIPTSPPDLFI